jgi:RNA polymerase sigma factor for flagellar operon FliA
MIAASPVRSVPPVIDRVNAAAADPAPARATDALIAECLPLVKHHVRSLAARLPSHVDLDDLMSAGMYALAACAGRYDPSVGTSFAQFASARIRGALLDELRAADWASRSVRKRAREATATADQLGQELGRTPTAVEVAQTMQVSVEALSGIRADAERGQVVSLQAVLDLDADVLPVDPAGPETALLQREQYATLQQSLGQLPERLRNVIEQYFFAQRKLADIAVELGVTESRVSQLRSQALLRLRELMAEDASADDVQPAAVTAPGVQVSARREPRRAPVARTASFSSARMALATG